MLDDPTFTPPTSDAPTGSGQHFRFNGSLIAASVLGSKEHAARWYPEIARLTGQYRYMSFDAMISERMAGMTATTAGMFDEAERHLIEATRIAAEDPNFLDAPHVDYWFARMLVERGRSEDRDDAFKKAALARDEFARRDCPPYVAMADALLEQLAR